MVIAPIKDQIPNDSLPSAWTTIGVTIRPETIAAA